MTFYGRFRVRTDLRRSMLQIHAVRGASEYGVPGICRSWERRHEAQKLSPNEGQKFSTANKGGQRGGSTVSGSWTSQIPEMPVTLLIWPRVAGYERGIDQHRRQTGALGTG